MYIEKKKIGDKEYYYLKLAIREGNKVKTKTVAYFGKKKPSKDEIDKKISEVKSQYVVPKSIDHLHRFLSEEQIRRLVDIKKDFGKKIGNLDPKIIEDMFKDFKTYYIYNTNAIEGNTLTLEETNQILNDNISLEGKDLREIFDHVNEREAFDHILKERPEISHESIIKIQSLILDKIDKRVGTYRTQNVRVIGASFKTTPFEYVKTDMNLLLKWYSLNKKMHPLVRSALFHEKFERIHPFCDGNGRTGRMVSNMILIKSGFPPLIIENKDRKEYYHSLSVSHEADLNSGDDERYNEIVQFFYGNLVKTYDKIFSKWG